MKNTLKGSKLVTLLVLLTLAFLCVFNITYSYFTATANIKGKIAFYDLNLNFRYYYTESSYKDIPNSQSKVPLAVSSSLKRGSITKIKESATSDADLHSMRIFSPEDSCDSFVRFWIDVYLVKVIDSNMYYIDSLGNYVDDNGNYVDDDGNAKEVQTPGEVVNYANYFNLVEDKGNGDYSLNNYITKQTKTVNDVEYITYFCRQPLESNQSVFLFDSIYMSEDLPNELLGSQMCIYLSFDSVQKDNKAYESVFNDNRGYLDDWGDFFDY